MYLSLKPINDVVVPELSGLKKSRVTIVSGKTRQGFTDPGTGTTYLPGLKTEAVYSAEGVLLRHRTSIPAPPGYKGPLN